MSLIALKPLGLEPGFVGLGASIYGSFNMELALNLEMLGYTFVCLSIIISFSDNSYHFHPIKMKLSIYR